MSDGRHRVLVIEDDPTLRGLLADLLILDGFETRTTTNGQEALALLQRWRPDVILLDLMMPVMDGWAFRAEQQRRPEVADIPVIIMSAAHELDAHGRRLAATDVVEKPFDLDDLIARVERLVA